MENQMQVEEVVHLQNKVAGFDGAIQKYRQVKKEASRGVISRRKEEYVAYVHRVVFKGGDDNVVPTPDTGTQIRVVARMKDLK